MTIAPTQAYALRQLDTIADKLQTKADLGEVAKATAEAEPKIHEWLAVLARTFQLQDGVRCSNSTGSSMRHPQTSTATASA